jgi:hypothetical protein
MLMINKHLLIVLLLLFLSFQVFAQEPETFPAINNSNFPNALFEVPKTFTGASLYGYMDGGADLYLEYGFSGAWVDEVTLQGVKYTIELYKMNSPEEAFGIYSVSRYHCSCIPALSQFTCQAKYQLQIVAGSYYINIINSTGTSADSIVSLKIGEAIVGKIKEAPASFGSFLPDIPVETINQNAVLVQGELGVRNGAPDLIDLFEDIMGYRALILQQQEQTTVSVIFDDKEKADAFYSLQSGDGEMSNAETGNSTSKKSVVRVSDNHVVITLNQP